MQNSTCNGIVITEKFEKGDLGGRLNISFSITYNNITFLISITQNGTRTIKISSSEKHSIEKYWELFNKIDMLLMLLEGEFVPIESGSILMENSEMQDDKLSNLIIDRVKFYNSAGYTKGNHSKFLSYVDILSESLLQKWFKILDELDIVHNMVLYSMSNIAFPIDCKCAFLIESFEGLAELIKNYDSSFELPKIKKGESKLGKILESIINLYGTNIFKCEFEKNRLDFMKVLVNSRNRIAHIKSKQGKLYLNDKESLLYAVKLTYLYRIVLFELLGINQAKYERKLKESVGRWNKWEGVLDNFLLKL